MYMMSRWTIADARRRFATVLRSAAREPQAIYNRDRLVASVVAPDQVERTPSIADSFAELRRTCEEEGYELIVAKRRNRANPFARTRR